MQAVYEQRQERLFIGGMTEYPVAKHVHEQAELVIIREGTAWISLDDVQYCLHPGDAAVMFPLVPHSFDRLSGESRGLIAIFPPDMIPEFTGTFHGMHPVTPLLRADQTGAEFRIAADRLDGLSMEENLPLCVAYLHVLLADMIHRLPCSPVYDYNEQDLGHRIISYVSANAYEEITLENAAYAMGISASHLSHFFSEKLHVNFRRFVNSLRIEKARLMMRDPTRTLTEICGACGYNNMRTFRRAFQKETSCLPSDYIRSLREKAASLPK